MVVVEAGRTQAFQSQFIFFFNFLHKIVDILYHVNKKVLISELFQWNPKVLTGILLTSPIVNHTFQVVKHGKLK